jgi:DNA invertase Pin-like site-specific DNA recombinase
MIGNRLRVAAYCRVSTDKEDQSNSLISQRKYFSEYITGHADWVLTNVYYDDADIIGLNQKTFDLRGFTD